MSDDSHTCFSVCPLCGNPIDPMIEITKSPTADTRSCDFATVTREMLLDSSRQHIDDVQQAMKFFSARLLDAAWVHDADKLDRIDWFHADFVTGFKQTGWWDNHRQITRHHLNHSAGVPSDVNLLDVLEFIADCVVAGMARTGSVYPLELPVELLQEAFINTVDLLKMQIVVKEEVKP